VRWLRERVEMEPSSPERIMTVRGVGYKFLG
jgi:DNA-binding response OmpR family regulator